MKKTKYDSYLHGKLPKGCALCVKGAKLVLFITGICPRSCSFCPISDDKNGKDVIYADEWKIKDFDANFQDIVTEGEMINAKGTGITGGDPLARMERTCKAITGLKGHFGKEFHIHLYTSLDLVTKENLSLLHKSGLDEIRFHFDIDDDKLWNRITLASDYDWDIGVEIPVIPKKFPQYKKIVDFIHDKVSFLNLNELEIPDNEFHTLKNVQTKNDLSYAAKGSEELGIKIVEYVEKNNFKLNTHYCTARLKDAHQLANRLKRRAMSEALPSDEIDEEGLLHRGVIYLPELKPGVGYRKTLNSLTKSQKDKFHTKLTELIEFLKTKRFKETMYKLDMKKLRILTSIDLIEAHQKELKENEYCPAIVSEYPTHDALEIELEFL